MDTRVRDIALAIKEAGGRALMVGGSVRDRLLRVPCKDVDIEVLGLDLDAVQAVVARFGQTLRAGRAYPVVILKGLDVDFSAALVDGRPTHDYAQASLRRDLTINAIAEDPLDGSLLDPHGGRADLEARRLRATSTDQFGSDPLRALRVAQFIGRFDMQPDAELKALCAEQDLGTVAGERIFDELRKLLMLADRPSKGLAFLSETRLLSHFPEFIPLATTPQDPEWHPEGDVWTHTLMAVDAAAALRDGGEDDLALMFAVLCHDLGKPLTTVVETPEQGGRIRSPAHDHLGVEPTNGLMQRLRAPTRLRECVAMLVETHLAPALFIKNEAGPKGYRRLARKLDRAGASLELLVRVARADHFGRTTEEALACQFPDGDRFLDIARALTVVHHAPPDVVLGRHLVARGLDPGPTFGRILERCREIQDETGELDPSVILDRALSQNH
jgi:tRNA nucleotidyltransferase (CCA-adding enzyme)